METWQQIMDKIIEASRQARLDKYLKQCEEGAVGVEPMPEVLERFSK